MSDVPGAFFYLTVCTIRNSVRLRLRRLRQPRYLAITIGLVLYVGSMLLSRPSAGIFAIASAYRESVDLAAIGMATLLLGIGWVLPNPLAFAFSSAEVHLLFPAPVSRRQLVGYKIWRLLLGAVATSLLFMLMMAPPRPLPAAGFASRAFVALAVIALYSTGVALHRKRTAEGFRPRGLRRFAIAATALVLTPAIGWVLARVALGSAKELLVVLPIAAAVAVACGVWILRSDAAFEEAAAESAEKVRLAVKGGYRLRPRLRASRSSRFALAPQGPIEMAILWKNWMRIGRTPWTAIGFGLFILVCFVAGIWIGGAPFDRDVIGFTCFAVAVGIVLFGPGMITVDLRQDLAHLALIKTWPVTGAAVFRGELLAPLLALALGMSVPILLGSALTEHLLLGPPTVAGRASFGIAALLAGTALVLTQLVIQNGIAVTFPAWVRITPGGGGGGAIEAMGQKMLTLYGGMLAMGLAAIVPAAAAAAAWFLPGPPWTQSLIPGVVFSGSLRHRMPGRYRGARSHPGSRRSAGHRDDVLNEPARALPLELCRRHHPAAVVRSATGLSRQELGGLACSRHRRDSGQRAGRLHHLLAGARGRHGGSAGIRPGAPGERVDREVRSAGDAVVVGAAAR